MQYYLRPESLWSPVCYQCGHRVILHDHRLMTLIYNVPLLDRQVGRYLHNNSGSNGELGRIDNPPDMRNSSGYTPHNQAQPDNVVGMNIRINRLRMLLLLKTLCMMGSFCRRTALRRLESIRPDNLDNCHPVKHIARDCTEYTGSRESSDGRYFSVFTRDAV